MLTYVELPDFALHPSISLKDVHGEIFTESEKFIIRLDAIW